MATILIVEDSLESAQLMEYELLDEGFEVSIANSGEQCLDLAVTTMPDLILLDMYMPGMNGLETLEKLKRLAEIANIPVIMVSASEATQDVIRALDLGASDYVIKPVVFQVLAARMRSALRLKQATEQLESANRDLKRLATTDPLTKLSNRGYFFSLAKAEFSKAQRHKRPLSIIMLDVDNFKSINDTYGHAAGDAALSSLSKTLTKAIRDSDIVGRVGGEEFAVCCPDADLNGALAISERIRKDCEAQLLHYGDHNFRFTVSLGVTSTTNYELSLNELINKADRLLYHAKHNGKNRSVAS